MNVQNVGNKDAIFLASEESHAWTSDLVIPAGESEDVVFDLDTLTWSIAGEEEEPSPENEPPSVSVTTADEETAYTEGTDIHLVATASDTDGTVTGVAFYLDGANVAEDTESPYEHTLTGLTVGSYTVLAAATDDDGAVATSSALSLTVEDEAVEPPPDEEEVPDDGGEDGNDGGVEAPARPARTSAVNPRPSRSILRTPITPLPSPSSDVASPSISATYRFARDLQFGSRGPDVSALQTILKDLGFYGYPEITDFFGVVTEAAVIAFQRTYGIVPAAGYVGTQTRGLLERLNADGL